MLKRLKVSPQALMFIEAGLVGLFFIQALRFLVGMLYTRTAGASITLTLNALNIEPLFPGTIDPRAVQNEISFVIAMLGLPLLGLIIGRIRPLIFIALLIVAVGRVLMNTEAGLSATAAAGMVVGGTLLYLVYVVRWRANLFPYLFIIGIAGDQIIRAAGNTLDPSWSAGYLNIQIGLSFAAVLVGFIALVWNETRPQPPLPGPSYGLLPFWGGIGLGSLLFLQLSLLALPNAAAGRSGYDYAILAPFVAIATLLPLVPGVRGRFGALIGTFDASVRGWLWMLLSILLLVFGTRLSGVLAGISLVLAQFIMSMVWWWLLRRRTEKDRSFAGLWLVLGILVFGLLVAADTLTYEYAYIRPFVGDFAFLNQAVLPLLRAFRGFGLPVLIFATFLAALPMTQIRQRIPWTGGSTLASVGAIALVAGGGLITAQLARPPLIAAASDLQTMRVGTYNIHAGTDEFFNPRLADVQATIQQSGANVVLLQEVEAGRLTSFGVDQSLWLARRIGMDRHFFATNEGLRGLAVLSNIPIAYADGELLDSLGEQTGLQRVQIQPTPESVLEIYNTWLGYLLEPTGDLTLEAQEQDQQRQLNQIFQIIADQHPNGVLGRTVFGGTFNNVPDAPLMDQIRAVGFIDPFAGLPLEVSATLVRSGVPRARLDYLWLRNLTPAEGVLVLDSNASDHRMAVTGILVE